MKYVTRTGRSLGPGRVTRASYLVRTKQRRQEAPLPVELQVHPKRLTPTTRNPDCRPATKQHMFKASLMARTWTGKQFASGKGLSRKQKRYALTECVPNSSTYRTFGYTDDITFAVAWREGYWDLCRKVVDVVDLGEV